MNDLVFTQLLAAGYSCDAYGVNNYGECSTAASSSSTGSANSNGWLANTGYDILLPLALGLSIIIAAIILAIKTLRRRTHQR